jgi:hypothetical protein
VVFLYINSKGDIKGPFKLRSGWRGNSLSGLLTVKGTVMREQGSLKGEGTHRGNLFANVNLSKIWQLDLVKNIPKGFTKEYFNWIK